MGAGGRCRPAGCSTPAPCAPAGTGWRCARPTRRARPPRGSPGGWCRCPRRCPAGRRRAGHCWYPPHLDATGHPMRWDWQIGRVTPLQRTGAHAVDIYDIDGFLTTPAEVRALHTRWQAATLPHPKAVCYLDLAWEDYRPDGDPGAVLPRRHARQRVLRLPAGTVGGLPPARCAQADAGRADPDVRGEGLRRGRTGRHRQLRPAVHHWLPSHARGRAELSRLRVQRDPPVRDDRPVEELAAAVLVGAPLHGRRGRRGVLPLPPVLRLPVARQQPVRDHLHRAGRPDSVRLG